MRIKLCWAVFFIPLFLCISCTSVVVKPDIAGQEGRNLILKGKLSFDGNRAYLPATVCHSDDSQIGIAYEYKVFYDGTPLNREIISAFLPTTWLGVPTGGDDVLAVAKLVVSKKDREIKTYSAEAMVSKGRILFTGGTDKTEMRRVALQAIKENLESQMKNDYEMLSKLMTEEKL